MIQVNLYDTSKFLVVAETLTRIGYAYYKPEPKLIQACHIIHNDGKYYIGHYNELNKTIFTSRDEAVRNLVIDLLNEWGMLEPLNWDLVSEPMANLGEIKIVGHKDKGNWILEKKYFV